MGKKIIVAVAVLLGASLGALWLPQFWSLLNMENALLQNGIINGIIGAFLFSLLSLFLANPILNVVMQIENKLLKKSPFYLLFGSIGAIVGLVIGTLISSIFQYIPLPGVSDVLPVMIIVLAGYLGFGVGTRRSDTWGKLLNQLKPQKVESQILSRKANDTMHQYKVVDTSTIIDGRIADIVDTRFIEGTLVIPLFVVHELQYIADSSDNLKRAKGRRGLDVLNRLQKSDKISVEIYEGDFEDIPEVDSKLVKLAKTYEAIVLTNDYNLNKVCEFQNVPVLNINELANAIKPVVLPGETMRVLIVKDGTERQQGVAYLNDGTMIVVEDGHYYMNEEIDVVITSALQTAAGRMIFAKPVHSQKKINETKA
ncbi:PIN/TRAM domain-containing protein [Carnobacteriaceae bacterium zg-ZUI252]|nr:PIN/TRAM domain-containing protein [Carnobacteriaceae bacterium zg-ZUI252]